jgi:hypothetical protein
MSLRSLLCLVFLALGVALAPSASAAPAPRPLPNPYAKYAGSYYIFVLNTNSLYQFGGVFRVNSGASNTTTVVPASYLGNMYDANATLYPISGNINSTGHLAMALINGANINVITVALTSVGQLAGRQENPGQIFPLSGAKFNYFFAYAGLYRGVAYANAPSNSTVGVPDDRKLIFVVGLQRRITGTFEQFGPATGNISGNYAAFFGSANQAGYNGHSALARSFVNALWLGNVTLPNATGNGTWRQDGYGNFSTGAQTGDLTASRVAPPPNPNPILPQP